jgi:hypothetical protein
MSHIVTVLTEIRDAAAVQAACGRLGLAQPVQGTTRLFSGEVTGLAVQLPAWQYAIPFVKVGRSVRYRKNDLDKCLDSRTENRGHEDESQ